MMYKFNGYAPQATHQPWDGWVAENATVLGQVEMGKQVSVWFGAVIRGDNSKISLGDFTNVQENAVLHTDLALRCILVVMSRLDIKLCYMAVPLVITP